MFLMRESPAELRLLVGALAHDLNNVLAGILGHAATLAAESGDPAPGAAAIQQAVERASSLTAQLLDLAGPEQRRSIPVDLDSIAREVAALVRDTTPASIRIELQLETGRGRVLGDPDQLHRMILNLALNARQAMPEGGALTLATRLGEGPRGPFVELAVCDTGHGIPESIRDRIFEPFFTTRGEENGSGLGLAIVHGIVRNHDGLIQVKSDPASGTTFLVRLPAAAGALTASAT